MKKYLFVFLIFVLSAMIFGENINSGKITLQSAINIAKTYFDVSSTFTNFSFNYNTYDDHQNWNLSWSSPQINDQSNGSLNITINASNGNVESMNYWNQSKNQPKYVFPKISRDQARKMAESFLNKIDSNKIDQLIHINNSDQLVPLTLPQSYIFEWERTVNGIPFSNDYVQISVDTQNGRITNYQMNWTDQKLPYPSDILTPEQAKSAFLSDDLLTLEYYPLQSTTQSTAILVYALSQNNGAIDAVTGKPLKLEDDQWLNWGYFSNIVNSQGKAPDKENNQAQLAETKFIDEKTAVDDLKKIVEISSNLELTSANLAYNSNDGRIVWNLYWWNQNEAKSTLTGTVTSIFAGIDALNGSLDHLYLNYQNESPKSTPLNENEAQKIVESFLKKAQPAYFNQIRLNPQAGYKPQGAYNFVYDRIVNGIPFPANTINITVSDFGLVTSYGSNWSNAFFEDTNGIIPLNTAKQIFLDYRPLVLNYVKINNENNSTSTVKLVYLPEIRNPIVSNLLNAKTGEPINWNGMPIGKNATAYHFNDLNSTEYATYISYLGQAGLFGEYGDLFMPSGKITVEDFLRNLLAVKNGADYVGSLSTKQIIDTAVYDDLVPSTINPKKFLDEETLSEIMMRFLGLKIVAKVYGYQTLAIKLGITSDSSSDVTRLEAGISIIKAIELGNQN
ncbi:MAG: YcdB/YcdC domain-containing protein [Athalassotoga sp.]|uniref:YcdB/YcdC domain-containing protein n=1 Tax=Athalassotoga sp. TaxID=2022597 RepID=UPI003D0382AC